jgi:hypothetical protein
VDGLDWIGLSFWGYLKSKNDGAAGNGITAVEFHAMTIEQKPFGGYGIFGSSPFDLDRAGDLT